MPEESMAAVVPPLAPPTEPRFPPYDQRLLRNGLTVAALRRVGVPLVEVRIRLPLLAGKPKSRARAEVLSETLLAGTERQDKVHIAARVQGLGATLSVDSDDDWLKISGSVLSSRLYDLLELVAEVLSGPTFPAAEVTGEAARLAERIRIARSQAGVQAAEALAERLYGTHPYGLGLPDPGEVSRVRGAALRAFFAAKVAPAGGSVVLVGDSEPQRLLDSAETALSGWTGEEGAEGGRAKPPRFRTDGPLLLVDRAGSVQSSIRLGGPAPRRDDPHYPAFQLANLVFGGYFSSRLVTNLREEKGYTYSPHSMVTHHAACSQLTVQADVATEVTGPALLETHYELGRIASLAVSQSELDDAREYAIGSLAVGTASHAGLASTVASLLASGVPATFLVEHPARLRQVTVDQVLEQARQFLAPSRLAVIVVGSADTVSAPLQALGSVERG